MTIDASLDKRIDRVVRSHAKMRRNGVVRRVGRDGLIRTRARLIRPRFPLKGAFILLALLFAFKILLFAQLGDQAYAEKVQGLRDGTMLEQAGAVLMQEDRLTTKAGRYLGRFF